MKKFLDSDLLRGVQFYFKLHCMQCKLTKQEQRLETSRKSNMASGISGVNFHLFSEFFLHFELKIVCEFNNLNTRRVKTEKEC